MQYIVKKTSGEDVEQDVGWSDESSGRLTEVFKNGKLMKETSLTKVRNLLKEGL